MPRSIDACPPIGNRQRAQDDESAVSFVGLGAAPVCAESPYVTLQVHDRAGGLNAGLGDVEPVGDDEFASLGVELNVVGHADAVTGSMGVDKAWLWR